LYVWVVFASASYAAEKNFEICTAGGYFSGAQDRFLSGLALHIRVKRELLNNHICNALWKNAYAVGENLSKTGKIGNQEEADIVKEATEFSTAVYDLLSSKLNY
jgi:hypothetical protein